MKKLLNNYVVSLAAVVILFAAGGALIHPTFGAFNPTGGSTYYLQSSVSQSQTTITLTSFQEPVSNIPYTMAYLNTDIVYATINPETTRSEFVSFTGITQNPNGTATLTGVVRGLERSYPYVASTTLAGSYPGQTRLILSSPPQFFNEYATKRNNQWITGIWGFGTLPTTSVVCSNQYQFCNKAYIDAGLAAGAPAAGYVIPGIGIVATALQAASSTASTTYNAVQYPNFLSAENSTSTSNGVVSALHTIIATNAGKLSQTWLDIFTTANTWIGTNTFSATTTLATTTTTGKNFGGNITNNFTAGQAITGFTLPVPVSVATTTPSVWIADGDVASTSNFIGFAVNSPAAAGTAYVQTDGIVNGFSGLTPGSRYYVSDTAGTLSSTPGTLEIYVGTAISATQITIDHGPTSAQQSSGSTVTSVTTGSNLFQVPAYGRFSQTAYTIVGATEIGIRGTLSVNKAGITTASILDANPANTNQNCVYTFTWSGNTLTIMETETGITCTLTATTYWYR